VFFGRAVGDDRPYIKHKKIRGANFFTGIIIFYENLIKIIHRIGGVAVNSYFKMQMRTGGHSCRAALSYLLTLGYRIPK